MPAGDVGNLNVRDQRKLRPQARNGVISGHGSVVLIELQAHARMVHRFGQRHRHGNGVRPVPADVDIIDGLNEQSYSGIACKACDVIEIRYRSSPS
jgi:hypothetical protein